MEELAITFYMCATYTWRMAEHIHERDRPTLSSERLYNDYDRRRSIEKTSLVVSFQDELTGGKPPDVK
jgi:hypothetical protein